MSTLCSFASFFPISGSQSSITSSSMDRDTGVILTWLCRSRVMSFDNSNGNAHQDRSQSRPEQRSATNTSETSSIEEMLTTSSVITRAQIPAMVTTTSAIEIPVGLQSVRRRLFADSSSSADPAVESSERHRFLDERLTEISRQQQETYNFDFEGEKPLPDHPDAPYVWEQINPKSESSNAPGPEQITITTVSPSSSGASGVATTSRQTSLMGLLPVRCKARTSTSTTTTSSYGKGVKRPLSASSQSSSKEGTLCKKSKSQSAETIMPESSVSGEAAAVSSSSSSSSSNSSESLLAHVGSDKPSPS